MTETLLTRRRLILGTGAAATLAAVPGLALANSDALLADILVGVGSALHRDYIREHYGRGRWDGRYWVYEGRRYTPAQYRDYWIGRYRADPPRRPAAPPPRHNPPAPPHHNPPAPRNPGPGRGPVRGPGPDRSPGRGPGQGPGPR